MTKLNMTIAVTMAFQTLFLLISVGAYFAPACCIGDAKTNFAALRSDYPVSELTGLQVGDCLRKQ